MKVIVAQTSQDAAAAAAQWVAGRIRSAARLRGACRVAFSGGSTPAWMFDELVTMDLPWSSVHVFQVDERVAPDGDADRNAVQLVAHLTSRVPISASNVHLMPVTAKALTRAASAYAARLGDAPLDIVHLGIGDDGHTASWPPGDDVIDAPGAVAISDVFNGRVRMTMTPAVINAARSRMVLVVGAAKAEPLARWLALSRVVHDTSLPIARVRRTDTTVIADAAAGARLRPVSRLD